MKKLPIAGAALTLALILSGCSGSNSPEDSKVVNDETSIIDESGETSDTATEGADSVLAGLSNYGNALVDSAQDTEETSAYMQSLDFSSEKPVETEQLMKLAPYITYIYFDGIESMQKRNETLLMFLYSGISLQEGSLPADLESMYIFDDEKLVSFDVNDESRAVVNIDAGVTNAKMPMIEIDGEWLVDAEAYVRMMESPQEELQSPPVAPAN